MSNNALEQARGLIKLASRGYDPNKLIESTVKEIREGAGPYHIGSTVKINQPWTGAAIDGGSVSLNKGDVVSIVQTNLGEQGQDKMILLSDGKTRTVVPLKVLGEKVIEADVMVGPDEFMDGAAVPPPVGAIDGQPQGDSPSFDDEEPSEATGLGTPSSQQGGDAQGQPEPTQDPSAQVQGSDQMTASAVAVEAVKRKINTMLSETKNSHLYQRINEFRRALASCKHVGAYCEAYEMLFGNKNHTLTDLERIFEQDPIVGDDEGDDEIPSEDQFAAMTPEERKKFLAKSRKRYQDQAGSGGSTATQTGPEDQSVVVREQEGGEYHGGDEEDDVDDDELVLSPTDLRKFLKRFRRKYQNQTGMTGGEVPQPQDMTGVPGDDEEDEPSDEDQFGAQADEEPSDELPSDEDPSDEDQFATMTPEQRRRYIKRFRMKYRGKYASSQGQAQKNLTKYGQAHARSVTR